MLVFYMALETVEDKSQKQRLEEIYNDYSRYVKNIVLKFYPDLTEESEDIVQQVFVLVIKNKDKFVKFPEKIVKSMLYYYTKSISINLLKRRNIKETSMVRYAEDKGITVDNKGDDLPKNMIKKEYITKAKKIINSLPYPEKEIIVMKYIYGMKNVEIAEVLDLTETNVGTMLQRSLKKVKQEMEENDYAGMREF